MRDLFYHLGIFIKPTLHCKKISFHHPVSNILPCIPLVAWEGQCCLVYQTRNCQSGIWNFQLCLLKTWSNSLTLSVSQYPHLENEGKWYLPERGVIRRNQRCCIKFEYLSIVIRNICYYVMTFQLTSWWFLTDKNSTSKLGLYPLEKWLSMCLLIPGKKQEEYPK